MVIQNEILVVDDEIGIRELLSEILEDEGYTVKLAENAGEARAYRNQARPSMVLLDIWMPDTDGITLLREWAAAGQLTMPVVMLSGHGTIETAVEATRIGAFDFLEKPVALQKLLATVGRALKQKDTSLPPPLDLRRIGASPQVVDVERRLQHFLMAKRPILLTGEPGSPFENCAQALRAAGAPWVKLDGGQRLINAPLDVLQQASGGVLFCSEIGNYSRMEQKGLAFVLSKFEKYALRLVCSTSEALGSLATEGKFDAGLLAALTAGAVTIPPLRMRTEDIPLLVELKWRELTGSDESVPTRFSTSAIESLRAAPWPGNHAQLDGVVTNLTQTITGEIATEHVHALLSGGREPAPASGIATRFFELPLREAREAFERLYFEHLLGKEQNNMSRVADRAGLERTHLYRKLKQLNIRFLRRHEES
ncbi:MAG: sigma-54 dependent transcriptional regulator [Betaproteobacteria bacterium]